MSSPAFALWLSLAATSQVMVTSGGSISRQELEDQRSAYQELWDAELITRLDDLPATGTVPDFRVPYSGHDYPDKVGGTLSAMAKYDRAFYRGQSKAYQHEREDLDFHRTVKTEGPEIVRRGLFGRVIGVTSASVVPHWYGHCNGWTAASIRHAEPQKSVTRNGTVFTPADIKGMLAELYMYSHTQSLGGDDKDALNPGTLHLALANWIGRQSHPIAMETALGEPVINFPVYAYKSTLTKLSANRYDVRTLITFTLHLPREADKAPKSNRQLYFHYVLDLDAKGNIIAGQYLRDSGRIDMVWVPLQIVQGGGEGNRGGNPHLKVDEVLSIYRESVDEALLKKWVNIDPSEDERALAKNDLPQPETPKTDNVDKPAEAKPEAAPAASAPVTNVPAAPATNTPATNEPAAEAPAAAPQ
jgi:hypothetical protein